MSATVQFRVEVDWEDVSLYNSEGQEIRLKCEPIEGDHGDEGYAYLANLREGTHWVFIDEEGWTRLDRVVVKDGVAHHQTRGTGFDRRGPKEKIAELLRSEEVPELVVQAILENYIV